jgi:sugar O-acyltransferase (sialic acid O-acetyltransferase NeuD family)
MITKIVIIGASGFGREVLWTIKDCNKQAKKYEVLGFVDDDESLWGKVIDEYPVLGGLEWFSTESKENIECVIGISDSKTRRKIVEKLAKQKIIFSTVIHPSVIYSKSVSIGQGTIIQAGSILTIDIHIGDHVHVNIDSTVGHDTIIGDFVTINPGVNINGNTTIGNDTFVGTGTVMNQKLKIGNNSIIGAGTVLLKDVPAFSMYVGVPGKMKKNLK